MAEPHHKQGSGRQWIWWYAAAIVAVLLVIGFAYKFSYHYGQTYGQTHASLVSHLRAWFILIIIVLGLVLVAYSAELLVLALPCMKGLLSERRGRSRQAAEYYRRALDRYLPGGPFPVRNAVRAGGIGILFVKYDIMDLDPERDRDLALIKKARTAVDRLEDNFLWRHALGNSYFQGLAEAFSLLEAAAFITERTEDATAGRLGRLEERLAKDDPELFTRAMSLYQLGYYQEAAELFDRIAQDYQEHLDKDDDELIRLLGAYAAWEAGDKAGCQARLRGLQPVNLDVRIHAIGLKGMLASAQGKPEKAVMLLSRVASRVRDTAVDPDALAWMVSVRATALRMLGRYEEALAYASQASSQLQKSGPLMALDSKLEMAQALNGLGRFDQALEVAAGATADLDASRYELGGMGNRVTFARANEKARALALELAVASSPCTAAELVESARVQGLPAKRADDEVAYATLPVPKTPRRKPRGRRPPRASPSSEDSSLSAARTAAGMAPLTAPPRLRLFAAGGSGADTPDRESSPAGEVVLAHVAAAAAGGEWWWWGSWAAGGHLYWSLIGHDGTVEAAAIPLASLEPVLARLAAALPSLLDGETSGNVARARSGALASPDSAVILANELGEMLIPPTLRNLAQARAAGGRPLSLVVAPATELGQVPFGLLGLGKAGMHLAHGAIIRLGASAALLEQVRHRKPGGSDQRVLCVIDPCGRELRDPSGNKKTWSLLPDGELERAGIMEWPWLRDAVILSRSGHLPALQDSGHPAEQATVDQLGKVLRTAGGGTLAYIGHVSNPSEDVPANASLVLDDDSLSARDLFYDHDPRTWPMPSRVALIGCGSGGTRTPEWLGLAPASLWTGAQIVAVTSWDLIDEADTWKLAGEVVSVLHRSADPAAEWRVRFMRHLAEWKSRTGPSLLSWGAIQFIGTRPS
jgi:tetratricopeptide (TPR) repeat protein